MCANLRRSVRPFNAAYLRRQASQAMHTLRRRLLCAVALQCLVGCAALIARTGTDEAALIHAGVTEAQLSERLGPPVRGAEISPVRRALDLH